MSAGRPKFEPTKSERQAVTALVACGTRQDIIAQHLSIDKKTLRKHFRKEIEAASVDANSLVAKTLFQKAVGGNLTACIFWLKTRAGWRETAITELRGPNGGPLTASILLGRANGEPISDAATAASAYAALIRNPSLDASGLVFATAAMATSVEPVEPSLAELTSYVAPEPVRLAEPVCEPLMGDEREGLDNVVGLFTRLGK